MSSFQGNDAFFIVAQTRAGVACGIATSGKAKTAMSEQAAEVFDKREYLQFLIEGESLEDQTGLQVPGTVSIKGNVYDCHKAVHSEHWLKARHGHALIHLDELNHASRPLMGAIQETWLNHIPENSIVFATCNPSSVSTAGKDFPTAVVNRLCLLDWEFDEESYDSGFKNACLEDDGNGGYKVKYDFPKPSIPKLPSDWKNLIPKWFRIFHTYKQQANTAQFFDWDALAPTKSHCNAPWISPRSWRNAIVNVAAAESVGASTTTTMKILKGFVGEDAAKSFIRHIEGLQYPSSLELFTNPERLRLPVQFDTQLSIVAGVLSFARSRVQDEGCTSNARGEAFESGLDFVEQVYDQSPELGSSVVQQFVKLKPTDYTFKARQGKLWSAAVGM